MKARSIMAGWTAAMLLVAGCSGGGGDSTPSSSSSPSSPEVPECLEEVKGTGDLEITDQALTVMGSESEGYRASYVFELTNHSDTHTMMATGLSTRLVDDDGEEIDFADDDDEVARDFGQLEYIEPGGSKYTSGTFVEKLAKEPSDLKVEFPDVARKGTGPEDRTFWWPHDDVDYPPKLETSNVSVLDNGAGATGVSFDIDTDADRLLEYVNPVTVLRDTDGNLVGGQYSGVLSLNDSSPLEVPPHEAELPDAFPDGFPPETDTSSIEVQLTYSSPWKEVDEDCDFAFDPY